MKEEDKKNVNLKNQILELNVNAFKGCKIQKAIFISLSYSAQQNNVPLQKIWTVFLTDFFIDFLKMAGQWRTGFGVQSNHVIGMKTPV